MTFQLPSSIRATTAAAPERHLLVSGPPIGPQMGNVAIQCPTCRSWDVNKQWNYATPYYQCANCGYLWS